ncbi:MAG: VOC family protein [Pseudomonadales bacterium]|nr:VOC family protein [Pseudomonadales bacterium]
MSASKEQALKALQEACNIKDRSDSPIAKVNGLAYLVIRRPDIEQASQFFVDYGLLIDRRTTNKLYLRGKSQDHHIIILEKGSAEISRIGLTASKEDLHKLAAFYNKPIKQHEEPMGGNFVELSDPNGTTLEINCDLAPLTPLAANNLPKLWNTAKTKPRLNQPVRNRIEPKLVAKLGHTLWSVKSMPKTVHWYQDTLGFIVSDFQFLPNEPQPIVAFMRCDNGDAPSDHHTMGFGTAIELGHLHSAFEMDSFEELAVANQWMGRRDYKHGWGIGRHILGSQVFDYWRDHYGDLFEHYADGDLFDNSVPTGYHFFSGVAQHQWGPEMTAEFKGVTRPLKIAKFLIKRLPNNDDLNIRRLIRMAKAI